MGAVIIVDGQDLAVDSLAPNEASVPTIATDTSGAVANFTVGLRTTKTRAEWLALKDAEITLKDARYGNSVGTIEGIAFPSEGAVTLTCVTRMGLLSAYGVKAKPYIGNLRSAFIHYLSLAGVTSGYSVAASLSATTVALPGWTGELWLHLKQLAIAYGCDIGIVGGTITIEPTRGRTIEKGSTLSRSQNTPGGQLAQAVEVNLYETTPITNQLVYPPGGWKPETDVITINAGESIEQVLQLEASVSSISQPSFQTVVTPGHSSTSVYSVVGDDGLPVTRAAWVAAGGKLTLTINEDTTSLTLHVTAPASLPSAKGQALKTFSLALASATNTRYSTLRIVGTGVAIRKETLRVSTGVSAARTATEVGATVDNIFLTDRTRAKRAAIRVAKRFTGRAMTLNGAIIRALKFGEVAGARTWDESSRRWYRIRTASFSPESITFTADSDLLHSDVDSALAGKTYGQVKALFAGQTYKQVTMKGLPNG